MRKLITLGLTVAAVFAMGAITASAASALEFTGEAETFTGNDVAGDLNAFTAFGGVVECNHATTEYHASIDEPASTLTVVPTYEGCSSGPGTIDTVTMNECDYTFHVNTEIAPDHYQGTADLKCPEGHKVEVDVKLASNGQQICTITLAEQNGLGPVTYTNETADGALKIEGSIGGIQATRNGACTGGVSQETNEAVLHVSTTFNGLSIQ